MSRLNQLQALLGKDADAGSPLDKSQASKWLLPGVLGGLATLLVTNKSSRKFLSKYGTRALLVGGGAVAGTVLWNKYRDKMHSARQTPYAQNAQSSPPDARVERLILALVFAAKSDGHIDAQERMMIEQQLREAGVEQHGRMLIERALEEPLDPGRIANGVSDKEEALEIYFLSCAVIDIDHFMERSYLTALGEALQLPDEVRESIELDLQQQKRALVD